MRYLPAKSVSLFSASLVLVVACGGSEDSASDASEFAEKYCDYVGSCCGDAGLPSDGSQCRQLVAFAGEGYDADAGEKCLAAVRAAAAKSPSWCTESSDASGACDRVFESSSGTGAPGDTCESDSDCAAGGKDDYVQCSFGSGSEQQCEKFSRAKAGDACVVTARTSGDGSVSYQHVGNAGPHLGGYCLDADGLECDSSTLVCTKLGAIDADCSETTCIAGAYCDFGTTTCQPKAKLGASCSGSVVCVDDAYCDPGTSQCSARKDPGAACASFDECTSSNCEEGKCGEGFGASLGLSLLCGDGS